MAGFSDITSSMSTAAKAVSSTFSSLGSTIPTTSGAFTNVGNTTGGKWDFVNERLHVITPRNAAASINSGKSYISDRGSICKMRLLSPLKNSAERGKNYNNMDLTNDMNLLLKGTYSKFFLTDVSFSHQEKVQVNSVFGDGEVVYYFGRNPPSVQLNGIVFDSLGLEWFTKLFGLYEIALRGSQLAKTFELVEILLPNMKVLGSIASLSHQQSSNNDSVIQFNIQLVTKQVTPIPIPSTTGSLSNLGNILNFSVGKSGFGGKGFEMSIGNAIKGITSSSGFSNILDTFTSELNSFRNNVVSPVYGMISVITKVVKSATGDITALVNSFTAPVNKILGDITSIATEVVSLANVIEQSVNNLSLIPKHLETNLKNTLKALKSSAGVVSRVPENVSEIIKRNSLGGKVKRGSPILSTTGNRGKSKSYLLGSGKPYTTTKAYKL